jgi:hypothetical protein
MLKCLMTNKRHQTGLATVLAVGGTRVRQSAGPGGETPALHGSPERIRGATERVAVYAALCRLMRDAILDCGFRGGFGCLPCSQQSTGVCEIVY